MTCKIKIKPACLKCFLNYLKDKAKITIDITHPYWHGNYVYRTGEMRLNKYDTPERLVRAAYHEFMHSRLGFPSNHCETELDVISARFTRQLSPVDIDRIYNYIKGISNV